MKPRPVRVLVKRDTAMARCGVPSPEDARNLARRIGQSKGLRFGGPLAYPNPDDVKRVEAVLPTARDLWAPDAGPCEIISRSDTPSLDKAGFTASITENRAKAYIYNDRSLINPKTCVMADCALTVLTTVVSRPSPGPRHSGRGVQDADF